jgi:GNAT superfamily N-acetyltransferase
LTLSISRISSGSLILPVLHRETFPDDLQPDYSVGMWWVARQDGKAVGFAGMQDSVRHAKTSYLVRCGLSEEARGRGVQKRLIRARLGAARALGKDWVITSTFDNPASANSLIACGFRMYLPADPWGAQGTLYWKKSLLNT